MEQTTENRVRVHVKKILLITGDGGEELEVYYPLERMREEGILVVVASTRPKRLALKVHEVVNEEDTYSESPGRSIQATLGFEDVDVSDYVGVIIPGGRAPEYLRRNPQVIRIVQEAHEEGLPIAAVCHGPMILAEAGLLRNRSCTAVEDIIPEVEGAGGQWVADRVASDGQIVTAQTWEDCGPWMAEYVSLLRK